MSHKMVARCCLSAFFFFFCFWLNNYVINWIYVLGEICMFDCCKPCSVMWLFGGGAPVLILWQLFLDLSKAWFTFFRFDFVFFFTSGRPSSCSLLIFPHIKKYLIFFFIYLFFPLSFLCSWSSCRDNPRAMVIKKNKTKLVKINKTKAKNIEKELSTRIWTYF